MAGAGGVCVYWYANVIVTLVARGRLIGMGSTTTRSGFFVCVAGYTLCINLISVWYVSAVWIRNRSVKDAHCKYILHQINVGLHFVCLYYVQCV